ncbi:glycoside hydrolase family 16 [Lecanosticta acicola]|uniref:Glycoside hydrolase family 16 n=1 Tax=Lecanosticta acicola TaxID=111012 RepID=A0AAI9EAZ8_9PEZI|nr:glycoside hydrolase family 16 [Lecanosticta acicola]
MKTFTSVVSIALSASTVFASAPSTSGTQWTKTLLLDDFTGGSGAAPNSNNWILQTGTQYTGGPAQWGTGEIETYTTSGNNIRQAGNGDLWIIPQKSSSGAWTSARMESKLNNFAAPAGGKMRVEASIMMPNVTAANGAGYWPAFWMLGGQFRSNYTNWPAVGEVDIMEAVNGGNTQSNTVLHCDVNPGGKCDETTGLSVQATCQGSTCSGNFHIYEVVIDRTTSPESVKYWLDRQLVHTITATDLGATVWNQTFHQGFYLILNVAMGGGYPNAVAGTTTPTSATVGGYQMAVDYVAVWTTG